jgi:hypothetical protein
MLRPQHETKFIDKIFINMSQGYSGKQCRPWVSFLYFLVQLNRGFLLKVCPYVFKLFSLLNACTGLLNNVVAQGLGFLVSSKGPQHIVTSYDKQELSVSFSIIDPHGKLFLEKIVSHCILLLSPLGSSGKYSKSQYYIYYLPLEVKFVL